MRFFLILLIIFNSILFTSCSQESDEDEEAQVFINDPQQPGVGIGTGDDVRGVINLKACPNLLDPTCPEESNQEFNQVTLTWNIPSLYSSEEYILAIYKVQAVGENSDVQLENMPDLSAIQFEEVRLKDTSWTDTQVLQNETYFYWVFLILEGSEDAFDVSNGFWSDSLRLRVQAPLDSTSSSIPTPEQFWRQLRWDNITASPSGDPPVLTSNTFKPGLSTFELPKGRVQSAKDGAIVFITDTDQNRILVAENAQLKSCEQFINDDLQYFACRSQAEGAPPTIRNILGQPSQSSNLSCQEHNDVCQTFTDETNCLAERNGIRSFCKWDNNSCIVDGSQCLTKPTELLVVDDKLFISDSGNDRVVMINDIEFFPTLNSGAPSSEAITIGCDNRLPDQSRDTNPISCNFDKVFGKQNFDDFTTYSLANGDGISMLKSPTGLAVLNNDLYIADTGNNRIVKAADYNDPTKFQCSELNWQTSLCRWKGILGQESDSSNTSFAELYTNDPSLLSGTFSNELNQNPDLLKRYCRYPNKIIFQEFDNSTVMFISCNEDFEILSPVGTTVSLKGRILRYNTNPLEGVNPSCNSTTFTLGNCDADEVYGQEQFDELIILSGAGGGAGDYTNLSYSLESINDIAFINNAMMAIDNENNFIYTWLEPFNKINDGFPYSYRVEDPEGEFITSTFSLPNLRSLQGIHSDGIGKIYLTDGENGKLYQLDILDIPFE